MSRLNFKGIKLTSFIGILVSAFLSSFSVKIFVRHANLVSSGITGVVILLQKEMASLFNLTISFGLWYFLLNAMILLFVYNKLGKKFVILSFTHVILTSIFVEIIPDFVLTNDILLLTIFGGILNGLGIALALKVGGSSGGTDFIAIYYSTVKNKPMWNKVMLFNIMMLTYNGWRYNWTLSFYSIMYQFTSTEILSNLHDRYKLSSLRIITENPEEVSNEILKVVRHGITKFEGTGVFKKKERSMLYMVVNSFEIKDVVATIKRCDADAFVEISNVDRIEGNFRQRPLD